MLTITTGEEKSQVDMGVFEKLLNLCVEAQLQCRRNVLHLDLQHSYLSIPLHRFKSLVNSLCAK